MILDSFFKKKILRKSIFFSLIFHGAIFLLIQTSLVKPLLLVKRASEERFHLSVSKEKVVQKPKVKPPTTPIRKKRVQKISSHKKSVVQPVPQIEEQELVSRAEKQTFLNQYIEKILEELEKNKRYPPVAKRLRQEGVVEVKIFIEKSGKIQSFEMVTPSRYSSLNHAALHLVQEIESLPEIPKELAVESLSLNIPIHYKMSRR